MQIARNLLQPNKINGEQFSEAIRDLLDKGIGKFPNDFRWSLIIIPWHDLLLPLEGHEVHLPAPKTHYRCDFSFKGDTPIFCTAKEELSFVLAGKPDERETEMISFRWRVLSFSSQISEAEQLQVPHCPRSFGELVYPQS